MSVFTPPMGEELIIAAEGVEHMRVLANLIQQGPNTHRRDLDGGIALRQAAFHGNIELCHLLLRGGADANACSPYGETLLMTAAAHGRSELCRLLINTGVSLVARNFFGGACLHHCTQSGHVEVFRLLLEHGMDPMELDIFHNAALDIAHESKKEELAAVQAKHMDFAVKAGTLATVYTKKRSREEHWW